MTHRAKDKVGTNVASDALANLASGGVTGSTLIPQRAEPGIQPGRRHSIVLCTTV
ncbi:hypothetical protein SBA4_3090002 [Candidatus Sulfopaludibacter sp. SbA4]|nr:hypothetical protein SBA4_3090002 [Candidatus Sulfopaludibacter sp. SbA4]